jgi:hypothetical protein
MCGSDAAPAANGTPNGTLAANVRCANHRSSSSVFTQAEDADIATLTST